MDLDQVLITVNHQSDIPKYRQIVTSVSDAVSRNLLQKGDELPSVNAMCKANQLSRDTVFKAYSILKDYGIVDSVPNKGYYVANDTRKVILVLDTFKAYKEVLYHSFINNLPNNIIADVQFHHYNIENFKTIINNSIGKYYKYVIMNFDHKEVAETVAKINIDRLLLIDWNVYSTPKNNYVCQDFGSAFYDCLVQAEQLFMKYKRIDFIYPNFTNHPIESVSFFKNFCNNFNFQFSIITDPKAFKVERDIAYISVSDRMLGSFLEQCRARNLEAGKDVGFLSYNETPMKKFIYKGISVISTDFKQLGTRAAEFIIKEGSMKAYVPTELILRDSL